MNTAVDEKSPMTSAQRWILALTSSAAFMIALDGTIVTTALTTIKRSLAASVESLEWTVSAYILTFAVLMLPASALGDRFGRRKTFLAGLVLFTGSSAACGLSQTIAELIAARAVQGVGAAVIMPLAVAQLGAAFPPRERGRAMGISAGIIGLATASGPFVGGVVAQGLAWQWLFRVNVPVGVAVIAGVVLKMRETHGPQARLDLVGAVLTTLGALGLVWALVRGDSVGWTSGQTIGALAGGVVLIVAFVLWERRTAAPMIPMRLFTHRAFSAANVASFALTAAMYGLLFFLAQYFQTVLHCGAMAAGARMVPFSATLLVFGPVSGRLADRVGERHLVAGGLALVAAGLTAIALQAGPQGSYTAMLPALIAAGAGISTVIPPVQKAVVGAVQPHEIGQASGVFSMLRQSGALFGTALSVAVFAASGSYVSARSFSDGFTTAMGVSAAVAGIGALVALLIPNQKYAIGAVNAIGAVGPGATQGSKATAMTTRGS
ncbi:DHA2 family efflux MFS transporter permease subunit [Actinospica robiniae]|uniref:DHA2 family efflux MFS transporter permease subunit n=1 Tax=Actinospica robiniae TaxID=304901 RepID=UPI001FDF02AB|nr:DHA2 family efflux MFS transporter permease subunit [Actinospica robiniae]